MKLTSTSFADGQQNSRRTRLLHPRPRPPRLPWQKPQPATGLDRRSRPAPVLRIICHDPDVPSKGDDVNQEGRSVPASLPRVDFFHWVLIDVPVTVNTINEAEFSGDVTPRGKPGPQAAHGCSQGINNYTDWFAGDNDMRGDYYGYDGPCPPWNDEIIHHYVFTIYALDIETLPLSGKFGGPEVRAALDGHIMAEAKITGTYTLNPRLI
jgi:Raf kinase inhibitor-like YbhB/YbcL family protein